MGERSAAGSRQPILVTGVPRSGTTWLARWLAGAPGVALPGRELMTPGKDTYALAGTLDGWARLTELSARQRRALTLAYRGLNPLVYSRRYGTRHWSAPLPTTRLVVKDPFALLSMPVVVRHTGALPVLVYRHPGAVLTSYRRMGWTPDLAELQAIVEQARTEGLDLPDLPAEGTTGPAEAMGRFWATLHELALADITDAGVPIVVVAHHELAGSGPAGGRLLAERLGLGWTAGMERELAKESDGDAGSPSSLHNFDRAPAVVAQAWRAKLDSQEIADIERVTETTRARLDELRLPLSGG
jgi:hypothetical protein